MEVFIKNIPMDSKNVNNKKVRIKMKIFIKNNSYLL